MNRYSLASESRRWWWPSAAAGAASCALIAAVLASPSTAQPVPDPGDGRVADGGAVGSVAVRTDCADPPDPRYVGVPWVPRVATGCPSLDAWWRYVAVP